MGNQTDGDFQITPMIEEAQNTKTDEPEKNEKIPAEVVKNNVVTLPQEFGYRLFGNLMILALIFLLGFVTLLLNTDMVAQKISDVSKDYYDYTAKAGFVLNDIVVTGREKTTPEELLNVVKLKRGDNFLNINIGEIKARLEKLPWVRQAEVKRLFFPNILQISLEERKVRSIWQFNDKFYPIDYDGEVINATFKPTKPILLVVGDGAPENVNELLESISANQQILERIKVANFISKRRWNLVLDDIKSGITIKLPEEDVKKAWKKLLKLDATKGILKRKLTIIDLRLKDKVTVKLRKTSSEDETKLRDTKEIKM